MAGLEDADKDLVVIVKDGKIVKNTLRGDRHAGEGIP